MNRFILGVIAVSLIMTSSVLLAEDIPVVPASVMRVAANDAGSSQPDTVGTAKADSQSTFPGARISEEPTLLMEPGVNQIIPIAIGHPNRIVTPFGDPEVLSTSLVGGSKEGECGEVCIKENVVYVATDKEHPVTMFITERGSQMQALSLTMMPRRIPPREVFLKLDSSTGPTFGMVSNPKAERWETSSSYVETLRTLFRKIALGEVPAGYAIEETPSTIMTPICDQPGMQVEFRPGQMFSGHNMRVFVGIATNVSSDTLEFLESTCGDWDVAAVTSWPLNILEPGERTEVYIARKIQRQTTPTQRRPSLLRSVPK